MATDRNRRRTTSGTTTVSASDSANLAPADERVAFMDVASHEMRSPLTALSGTAQILQRRLRQDPERAADLSDLDKILYHAARLANQVDVFLAAAHLAQQRFETIPTACDAVAIARRVTDLFGAASRGRAITFDADAAEVPIIADRKRLEELLTILLSNAVKYSPRGDIAVRVTHTSRSLRVEVADRGIGVPPAERHRIFEPYVRSSNNAANSPGLGLYVAQAIVQRHRGKIGVRAHQGGGSVFWFELPLGL